MDFNLIIREQLEIALREEHDSNHEFQESEFDPSMCGKCGWYTLDSPQRPMMKVILQALKDGSLVIGGPVLSTYVVFEEVTIVLSRRSPQSISEWLTRR